MIRDGNELRQAYLEFFRTGERAHTIVPSAPLVPPDDPTLLFTSAGMVQFKALYSGDIDPLPYARAASCQKCLRAGGKGSDLENVGKTLRHHTLFEMLGNFSFGDYFKRDAIKWAWEFCTGKQWMALPAERIFGTIYGPTAEKTDREAESFWLNETGVVNPLLPLDESENFWGPAGETGACGPCSEIKFFMGSEQELREVRDLARSGAEGLAEVGRRVVDEGDKYLEIWNMVFPQFDQQRDGSRQLLKNKGIDTGAGLERMTTSLLWLDGKAGSPYETNLLSPIVSAVSGLLGVRYVRTMDQHADLADNVRVRHAVNAIADHARALCFCLAEGITPGNLGRGYVIRRIQRRALRFSSLLGMDKPFMDQLVDAVIEAAGDTYPALKLRADFIRRALRIEEEAFLRTRDRGMKLLEELIARAKHENTGQIPGEDAFKLWDTYGFPLDLTREVAEDAGLSTDVAGYDAAMRRARAEAKKSWKGTTLGNEAELLEGVADEHGATEFRGHDPTLAPVETTILAIVRDGKLVDSVQAGETADIVLEATNFYAEAGGQIGDTGRLVRGNDSTFEVGDTQKTPSGIHLHAGKMQAGRLSVGDAVVAEIDRERRRAIMRNHSSVHLLQAALKRHVGEHCTQAGSYVGPDYARFDFTNPGQIPADALRKLQEDVNRMILDDMPVWTEVLALDEARQRGAIAPFGEKYGAIVRVVQMGTPGGTMESIEFCGGTHLQSTGQAGRFRIAGESSIASGVRRIECMTGRRAAEAEVEDQWAIVHPLQGALAAKGVAVVERVEALAARAKDLEHQVAKLRREMALLNVDALVASAWELRGGARLVVASIDGLDGNELRTLGIAVRDRVGPYAVVALASASDGKVALVAVCGEAAQKSYPAGRVVNALAAPLGGKGGGKPDIAQAGAKDVAKLSETIAGARALVEALAGA